MAAKSSAKILVTAVASFLDNGPLAECRRVNAALTALKLESNLVGEASATRMADCVHVNTTLTTLVLGTNGIGAAGAAARCARGSRAAFAIRGGRQRDAPVGARCISREATLRCTALFVVF